MKILIAEDDLVSRRILESRLVKWGHQVFTAQDGKEAWELFNDEEVSIVITDWMMPGIDGVELVRRIRSSNPSGYVYTILITAKQQKKDLLEAMGAGADDFITKPFDKDELHVRLRAGERIIELEQNLAGSNRNLKIANEMMNRDLKAASGIQRSFLPTKAPVVPGFNFSWKFKPCEVLAGDFLNIFPLDESHVGLYVLDVCGHGVPAALLSVTLSRLLSPNPFQSILLKKHEDSKDYTPVSPADVALQLNNQFQFDYRTGQFFTLLYGILNTMNGEFDFVSAGHPGMVHIPRNSGPVILTTPGFPIGFPDSEEEEYDENLLQLNPGDRLYIYSDGITEAKNADNELFWENRLKKSLSQNSHLPLDDSLTALLDSLANWSGTEKYTDDITIIALERE
jgi:sigma-B regulation protein RsbU (phosphoserine phosphatase)